MLDDTELRAIEARATVATAGPWLALVEGRDHMSGDDFVQVGEDGEFDMYVSLSDGHTTRPASSADLDFIASARQDVPRLLAEIRRMRSE